MNNFRNKLRTGGYDSEEAYFYERDQQLIAKIREDRKAQLKVIDGGKKDWKKKNRQDVSDIILPRGHTTKKAA